MKVLEDGTVAESDEENQTGQTSIYNRSKSSRRDGCRYTTCACVFALTALVTDKAVAIVGAAVAGVAAVVAPLGLPTLICVMYIEYQLLHIFRKHIRWTFTIRSADSPFSQRFQRRSCLVQRLMMLVRRTPQSKTLCCVLRQ